MMDNRQIDREQLVRENETLRRRVAALQTEAERFKTTLYSIGDAVIATDAASVIVQMNPVAETLTGWSEAEARGRKAAEVFNIVNEETGAKVESPVTRVLREGMVVGLANHTVLVARDGTRRPIADSGAPIRDEDGQVTGVVLVFRDQTHERAAQQALQDSERLFRILVETMNDGLAMQDTAGLLTYANPRLCNLLGYSKDEIVGKPWKGLFDPEGLRILTEQTSKRKAGQPGVYEIPWRTKDGRTIHTLISGNPIQDSGGDLAGSFGVIADITERKRIEEALAESEAKFRALFENAQVGMYRSKLDGSAFLDVNKKFAEIIGFSPEELVGAPGRIRWADAADRDKMLQSLKAQGGTLTNYEARVVAKTGEVKDVLASITIHTEKGYLDGSMFDITDRKRAEDALRIKNQVFEDSIASQSIADKDGVITHVNPAFLQMWGYAETSKALGSSVGSFFANPADATPVLEALAKRDAWEGEFLAKRTDGTTFVSRGYATSLRNSTGELIGYQSTNLDVTRERESELALRESEERNRSTLRCIGDGVISTDATGRITHMNPVAEQLTGWPEVEARAKPLHEVFRIVSEETRAEVESPVDRVLREGMVVGLANHTLLIAKDGTDRSIADSGAPIRDDKGETTGVVLVFRDQTEERAAQKALLDSEERFRTATHCLTDIVYEWDLKDKLIWHGDIDRLTGYPAGAFPRTLAGWTATVHPEDMQRVQSAIASHLEDKSPYDVTYRVRTMDGQWRWWAARGAALRDERGKPNKWVGALTDITERKRAEQELDRLFSVSVDMIGIAGFDGYWKRVNPAWERALGHSTDHILSKPFVEFVHPEDREATTAEASKIAQGVETLHFENRYRCKDGSYRWLAWTAIPVVDEGLMYCVARDITESKQAEDALRTSEARYRTVVDNIPQKVFVKGRDFKWESINSLFARDLGKSPADIVGKVDYDLFPKDLADKYRADDTRIMETGVTDQYDEEYVEKGERRIVHTIKTPVRDDGGTICGVLGVFWDVTERKRAEQALASSEQFLSNVIEQNPSSLWIADSAGTLTKMNSACRALFGITDEEAVGKYNLLKDNLIEAQGFMTLVEDVFKKGEVANFTIDYDVRRVKHIEVEGATHRILDVVVSPLKDMHGKVSHALVQHRDITQRRRAEEALAETEKKYRALFETMSEGIVYEDHDGKIISANPAAERLLGLSLDQMQGRTSLDPRWKAIHEDGSPFPGETHSLRVAAMTGQPGHNEIQGIYNPQLDTYTWLSINSTPEFLPGEKKPFRAYAVFRDITERRRMEEELRKHRDRLEETVRERTAELSRANAALHESEERIRTTLYAIGDGVISTDAAGRVVRMNPVAEILTGWSETEAVGQPIATVFHIVNEETRAEAGSPVERVLREGIVVALANHTLLIAKDATEHPIADSGAPIRNEKGETTGVVLVFRDQTEERAAQRTLEESNKELEAFSYSVSHDLRAPLRAIDGFTRLLADDYAPHLNTEGKRLCSVVRENTRRMSRLIDDLLAFSRLGRTEMSRSRIDMETMASSVFHELTTPESRARIDFQVGTVPPAVADPTLMRQVWTNLLSNAIKFSSKRERAVIKVSAQQSEGESVYAVHDDGAGFDMQYVGKLFGVFQRLHSTKEFEGTGVGLALVQRVIRRHGGRIWAEGEPDKGATFYFALTKKGA